MNLRLDVSSGPAVARNRGAAKARGSILLFVDADVVIREDTVRTAVAVFDADSSVAAIFGSYDDVPAAPNFVQQQIDATLLPGATLGIGGMLNSTIDAIIVAYPTATVQVNHNYDLAGATAGTPPFVAAGYDINLDNFTPSASFYATRGTLRFTKVCADGFAGTLTSGHFVAVMGLMNPTLVPNGCAFDVPTMAFAYGNACPSPQ